MKKGFQKGILLFLCTACAFFLCGAAPFTQPAKLKSPSVRIIDLGEMVRDSAPGHGGNREASLEGEADEKDGTREGDGISEKQKEEEKELTVTVEDDRIFVNGEQMKDLNAFKVRLALGYQHNRSAKLVDDYASYRTYSEVYMALKYAGIVPEEEKRQ